MTVYPSLLQHLEGEFNNLFNSPVQIKNAKPVHGGDINECFVLETNSGKFFLKVNDANFGQSFFEKEAQGLERLVVSKTLKVPQPLFYGICQNQIYLVMEYLERGTETGLFWRSLGEGLALLHKNSHEKFGWKDSNYIGKLEQSNNLHDRWVDFYREERILNNIRLCCDGLLLSASDSKNAAKFCLRLHEIVPAEPPSLLHGDLWSGNIMAFTNGTAAVFDPSVYFGHREIDLAMTRLFGGFDEGFYSGYEYHFALAPGWQDRTPVFQLYPLLIHLRLFGGHYRQAVINILKKFS